MHESIIVFSEFLGRLRYIKYGKNFSHKLNLLCWAFLFLIYCIIPQKSSRTDKVVEQLKSLLLRSTILIFHENEIPASWYLERSYEELDKRELYDYFDKYSDLIIVEVGSFDGKDAIELKNLFPRSKVYAFEPDPLNYRIVKQNCEKFGIDVYKLAVSDRVGNQIFYPNAIDSSHRAAGSLLRPTLAKKVYPNVKYDSPIMVNTTTIAEWAKEQNIETIDFLWIDAEGAELKILKGGGDVKIKLIYLEIFEAELYENIPVYEELHSYLEGEGFELLKKYAGNALYVHSKPRGKIKGLMSEQSERNI